MFIISGPVQLRTSPLENLLIEHPSMSVYQRTGNRHPQLGSPTPSSAPDDELEVEEEIIEERDLRDDPNTMVVYHLTRNPPHRCSPAMHLNEMQVIRNRQAQKVR